MNQKEMQERIDRLETEVNSLKDLVNELVNAAPNGRNRGPKSERPMKDPDAYRVKYGDMNPKKMNHKEAADALGLSYGQVFSARGGYTFKHVKEGMFNDDGSVKAAPNSEGAKQ